MYRKFGKRLLDIVLSSLLLVLFAPVMALVAVAIVVAMGRPVVFRQRRPGLREQRFDVFKFRSMRPTVPGGPSRDSDRLTGVGRFLRATSLDELPQLLNVLRGDMSLVGPRPLLEEYLPYYTETERLRHSVRPGITGLAQINGRNSLRASERFALDVSYTQHMSPALDFQILVRTVSSALLRKGVQVAPAEKGAALVADWERRVASVPAQQATIQRRTI